MSLVAHGGSNTQPAPAPPITNNGFWPDIEPDTFRERHRIDTTITPGRVEHALSIAMRDINRQLADFQALQSDEGIYASDAVPAEPWQIPGHTTELYQQAVFSEAHARILESYRNYSATRDGDERGEIKDEAAEDYRRDARWAVSEIIGEPHTTVELI